LWGDGEKPFRSYHAESILHGAPSEKVDFDEAMVLFFDAAYDALAPGVLTPDPGAPNTYVDDRLDANDRREARDAVALARIAAHAAYEKDDLGEALDAWAEVFGPAFPAPSNSSENVGPSLADYGSWDASLLDVSGSNRIFFDFNPDRSGKPDFIGEVRFHDGLLWVRLTNRQGDFIRRVRAYHPEGDVLRTTIPRGLPNPDGNAWLAAREEYKTATGPCARGCADRIPSGSGWLKLTPGQ